MLWVLSEYSTEHFFLQLLLELVIVVPALDFPQGLILLVLVMSFLLLLLLPSCWPNM